MPVLPELFVDVTGAPLHEAARYGGYLAAVYALMQFFFSPVAGNLSDRFGRRPVLLISLAVFSLDNLIMGLAPTLGWLFLGRVIAGMSATTWGVANAYIADVFPPEERAANFGLMGAAFGAGFIVGPVIGGYLGEFGPRTPFFATAALGFANVLFGLFALPETLPKAHRRPFRLQRANPLGALARLGRMPVVGGILAVYFLVMLGHDSLPATWSFYVMERFGWTPREVGYSLGMVGVVMMIVQGGVIRAVMPRFGHQRVAVFAFISSALAFFGYSLSPWGWGMYAAIVIGAGSGLLTPALNGILSERTPANAQGELQGAMGSITGLTFVISPLAMTQLFAYFSSPAAPVYFPGAAFATAGLLTLAGLLVFVGTFGRARRRDALAAPAS